MGNGMEKRITSILGKSKVNGILLFNGDPIKGTDPNFLYYSGTKFDGSIFFATKRGRMLFTSRMNYEYARKTSPIPVEEIKKRDKWKSIAPYMKDSKIIGVDMLSLSASDFIQLKKKLHKRFVNIGDELRKIREIKSEKEIRQIKRAVGITKRIMRDVEVSKKRTEIDVANELLSRTLGYGCKPAFDPIVSSGKGTSFPHYRPKRKKLNGVVLIDYGVRYKDYCSDITRCFFLGPSKKERGLYGKVRMVFDEIVDALPSFEYAKDIANRYKKLSRRHGLPKPIHSAGHGIGLDVHEHPGINARSKEKLKENMVFAIEPGAYLKDFGARYENVVVYKRKKAIVL